MKALTPILLVLISVAALVLFVKPKYQEVKILRAEAQRAQQTLDRVKAAQTHLNDLVTTLNAIDTKDLDKLQKFLPDSVDTLRFLVDLNHLADQHKTKITNIGLSGAAETGKNAKGRDQVVYGETSVKFGVALSYRDFISFMKDLERSLKLIDISSVSFRPTLTNTYDYQVSLKTYLLK